MKLDTTKSCPECPKNWITQENHRVESLWISLRGWWNNERTPLRIEMIESILKELRYEKKITQKDITKLGNDISDFIKKL